MTNFSVSQLNEDTLCEKKLKGVNQRFRVVNGWLERNNDQLSSGNSSNIQSSSVDHYPSPHFTPKDDSSDVSLLVVHNISLPPNQFGGNYITDFFLGNLDKNAHPYFETINEMKVSAHCLIKRDGSLIQYVSFLDKAWHAGVSEYNGRDKCNDYSIGIELEGADHINYTDEQYETLAAATLSLIQVFPNIKNNIAGHNDIAPGRKTDPGEAFNWEYFYTYLHQIKKSE